MEHHNLTPQPSDVIAGTRVTAACRCGHRVLTHCGVFDLHVAAGVPCPGGTQPATLDVDTIVQQSDGHWSTALLATGGVR